MALIGQASPGPQSAADRPRRGFHTVGPGQTLSRIFCRRALTELSFGGSGPVLGQKAQPCKAFDRRAQAACTYIWWALAGIWWALTGL